MKRNQDINLSQKEILESLNSDLNDYKEDLNRNINEPDSVTNKIRSNISEIESKIRDLENKNLDKTYQEYPTQYVDPSIKEPTIGNIDYSEIMKQVTGSYPKEQSDLDEWKRNYANRTINSTVPLERTAKEIGILDTDKGQRFSDIVKTPKFQQFLKDMQGEVVSGDREKIAEEGTSGPRGWLTNIAYPQGIESVKSGEEYTPGLIGAGLSHVTAPRFGESIVESKDWNPIGDFGAETIFNVGEATPWGAPYKIGSAGRVAAAIARLIGPTVGKVPGVGKLAQKGIEKGLSIAGTGVDEVEDKVLSKVPKASRWLEKAPIFGAIANQSIMPVARETYNLAARDKELSDAAGDAGIGTAINFGTPLAAKGAFRGFNRAINLPGIAAKIEKLTSDVDKKRAADELAEATESLYKKKGLTPEKYPVSDIPLPDESVTGLVEQEAIRKSMGKEAMDAYENIAKKANFERNISPELVNSKAYANFIKSLRYNDNPLAEPYHEFTVRSAKPPRKMIDKVDEVLLNPNAPDDVVSKRLDNNQIFGKRQPLISSYDAWMTEDPYIKSLSYNTPGANQSMYYTKAQANALGDPKLEGTLTEEARRIMDLKGTKDPLAIERSSRFTPLIETGEDLAGMGTEFVLNAWGQDKDAARVVPYVGDKLVDWRESKKNVAKESPDEKEERWSDGYVTFEETKTPEYKAWKEDRISNLRGK